MAHCFRVRLLRSTKMSAILQWWRQTKASSSVAARCIYTDPHLAEIRSIAVGEKAKGQGAGGHLVEALLEEAESHCVPCVCLFTRIPGFFQRFGFVAVDRTALPDKIYKDCANCPRLNACDEFAMARGTLPDTAVLGPVRVEEHLVPLQI